MRFYKKKWFKVVVVYTLINIITQIVYPSFALALTSGPQQPEFTSFEPVATTNMVNTNTGSFVYNLPVINVPGPNGSGYPLSLSYHSGISPEQEASWVGLGWTLNPGAINRSKSGFPDDFKDKKINFYTKSRPSITVSSGPKFTTTDFRSLESLSLTHQIKWNNHRGYGASSSVGLGFTQGYASLSFSIDNTNDYSFSVDINPWKLVFMNSQKRLTESVEQLEQEYDNLSIDASIDGASDFNRVVKASNNVDKRYKIHTNYKNIPRGSAISGDNRMMRSNGSSYLGFSFSLNSNLGLDPTIFKLEGKVGLASSFSFIKEAKSKEEFVNGMLYPSGNQNIMDYSTEKEYAMHRRDNIIPVSFQNKDHFTVTGESMSGGFKLWHSKPGLFTPKYTKGVTKLVSLAGEAGFGFNFGGGGTFGGGEQTFEEYEWEENELDNYKFNNDRPVLRMSGDFAGNVRYTNNDHIDRIAIGSGKPKKISELFPTVNNGDGIAASNFVDYNTVEDRDEYLLNKRGDKVFYKRFDKSSSTSKYDYPSGEISNTIGEVKINNKDGQTLIYGLPVYNYDEKSLAYNFKNWESTSLKNASLYYTNEINDNPDSDLSNFKVKGLTGTRSNEKYASTYLMTQILSPDYVDRKFDGPTFDDFGAWTKFQYKRAHQNFKWRFPYNGLQFQDNAISTNRDNVATYSSGKKEIFYLKSIDTKTHRAFFVTNRSYNDADGTDDEHNFKVSYRDSEQNQMLNRYLTGSGTNSRLDAISASDDAKASSKDILSNNVSERGDQKLERLEKIVLFAINKDGNIEGKPLKIVHLEYASGEDQLCKNIPNGLNDAGKLTLKKVWFEYQDITSSVTRPYTFDYEYKRDYVVGSEVSQLYPEIINYGLGLNENPDYNEFSSDPWSNYRSDGPERYVQKRPWLDQTIYDKSSSFDPAAWHLKGIRLPSGGEIHVQYEEHDYQYVQNEKAMVMCNLIEDGDDFSDKEESFYIDHQSIGIRDEDIGAYVNYLNEYIDESDKSHDYLYFKFLYILKGLDQDPGLDNCKSDFISGYAKAKSFETKISSGGIERIQVNLEKADYSLPRDVCKDFVDKERNYDLTDDCDASFEGDLSQDFTENDDERAAAFVKNFLGNMPVAGNVNKSFYCQKLSLSNSYFRLPVFKKKRGGGVRVKRLFMYDKGLSKSGTIDNLYGTEFLYQNEDGNSSGVASNEPSIVKEENPIYHILKKRKDQKWIGKAIAGKDKEQFEGPYGASVLPSPSIAYERVVTRSIHPENNKINDVDYKAVSAGFTVQKFYSWRTHPVSIQISDLKTKHYDIPIPLPLILVDVYVDRLKYSQGFQYVISDMPGKVAESSTYAGIYNQNLVFTNSDPDYKLFKHSKLTYTDPNEQIPVLTESGNIVNRQGYVEEEVTIATKQTVDKTNNLAIQLDADVGVPLTNTDLSMVGYTTNHDKRMFRVSMAKVLRHYSLVKKQETQSDGVKSFITHEVFDSYTGEPVVSKAFDGFHNLTIDQTRKNGEYLSYTIPAYKVYRNMGPKSWNSHYKLNGTFMLYTDCLGMRPSWLGGDDLCTSTNAFINLQTKSEYNAVNRYIPRDGNGDVISAELNTRNDIVNAIKSGKLTEGDLIRLSTQAGDQAICYINSIDLSVNYRIYIQPLSFAAHDLIYSEFRPEFDELEVIESGYTNQLLASAASIKTYGKSFDASEPLFTVGADGPNLDEVKLSDHYDNILSASAVTYTDDWYHYDLTQDYDGLVYDCKDAHSFETAIRGKWRPKSSYVFEPDNQHRKTGKNYQEGVIDNDGWKAFIFRTHDDIAFNETAHPEDVIGKSSTGEYVNLPVQSMRWKKMNTVNIFSPNGVPLEEENILGIKSTAKFGYEENVPVLVANNAPYSSVYFNSFEDDSKLDLFQQGHAGNKSLKVKEHEELYLTQIEASTNAQDENDDKGDISVKLWSKSDLSFENFNDVFKMTFTYNSDIRNADFKKVAKVGEWTLYEAHLSDLLHSTQYFNEDFKIGQGPGYAYDVSVENLSNGAIYIDDIRIQPYESQMTTHVYEPGTLRLLASFDDQNFAVFYQYDAEGRLIRKKVETERGVKTITESTYNVATDF